MPDYNNNSIDDLIAPIKKGSLGVSSVPSSDIDLLKICGSETNDPNSFFLYQRDRIVDKILYPNARDGVDDVTSSSLNYSDYDQRAVNYNSSQIYIESNASRNSEFNPNGTYTNIIQSALASQANGIHENIIQLPVQRVTKVDDDGNADYSYLEPSVNYDSDGKEKCSRSTNNLFKSFLVDAYGGKDATNLDAPFNFPRATGTYQSSTFLHSQSYKTGTSPNGVTILKNDGFCFIARIDDAGEYGTLLLNFQQYHPKDNAITGYMINNHIQDPNNLLKKPRTFKKPNNDSNTDNYFHADSIDYQSMYKSILSPISLYSEAMWNYSSFVDSRVTSYPMGSDVIQDNTNLAPYIEYIQSYSKNTSNLSADLAENIKSATLREPFTTGATIQTVVPYGANWTEITATSRTNITNEHITSAYIYEGDIKDGGLHGGFNTVNAGNNISDQVIWNANSSNGATLQSANQRIGTSTGRPTVSNVIRADLSWRPYEIVVYRGTLTYDKNTGLETHNSEYVEYFRYRTFDSVGKKGGYNRANDTFTEGLHDNSFEAEGGTLVGYSYPVTGYTNEDDGNFVINFSENFNASAFTVENRLKVAVIQDVVVDKSVSSDLAEFTSPVFDEKFPNENRVFTPIYEDTLQIFSNDETLFGDINRGWAAISRPKGYGNDYYYVESSNTYVTSFYCNDEPWGSYPCFNSNQFIRANTGGPSAWNGFIPTAFEAAFYDCLLPGDESNNPSPPPNYNFRTLTDSHVYIKNPFAVPPKSISMKTIIDNYSDNNIRECSIPVFPEQNITQMDANGVNQTMTASEWGYSFSNGLAVRRTVSPNYGYENDTVFGDPRCVAGYINGFREVSWFARDLVASANGSILNGYSSGSEPFEGFTSSFNGKTYSFPPAWTMRVQVIKSKDITGIGYNNIRCSPNRESFHTKGVNGSTLNNVAYHCGECYGSNIPAAEFGGSSAKHEEVTKGFALTDRLNDHRSYKRIHDGGNM